MCYTGDCCITCIEQRRLQSLLHYLLFVCHRGADMATEVLMPQLGESIVEGTVARWLVAVGQLVQQDQPLLQITTDKVDTELSAPARGVLAEILVTEGQTVAKGTVLAIIEEATDFRGSVADGRQQAPAVRSVTASSVFASRSAPGLAFITPAVSRLAVELGVDLAQIIGTGAGGRITKKDVLAYVATPAPREPLAGPDASPLATEPAANAPPSPDAPQPGDRSVVPLSPMRRAIARNMALSVQTAPQVTTVIEADLTQVVAVRGRLSEEFERQGVRLTFTPFFIQALVAGLRAVPEANSTFREDALLLYRRIHIGVAVALADGLIVPVIRDADERSLLGLARAVSDLAERAHTGQLAPDEVQGGTCTLTNHGVSGSLLATPIIVQPQAGILGVGAIQKRPVVIARSQSLLPDAGDAIAIRPMVYLSFTFDHRVLDGATADRFLVAVKCCLEEYPG
jgi:2-oxoglutarate dehydrogenase E2 component (dihydrolipoamide succinyltransferase)